MKDKILPLLEELKSKIATAEAKIATQIAEVSQDKVGANVLCRMAGIPELYSATDSAATPAGPVTTLKIRADQFVGKSLSDAVAEYLEARKATGTMEGPATIDEIYDGLVSGGYRFEGSTGNPANHKRAMNIALTRNTAQMHKINDTLFGLRRWYGMRASRKTTAPANNRGGAIESENLVIEIDDDAHTPSPAATAEEKSE